MMFLELLKRPDSGRQATQNDPRLEIKSTCTVLARRLLIRCLA
jgi:hypothetical protein